MAHIRKRGKTYSYTIDLGKDPVTGKRKQINKGGFIRKKDAEAAARKIESAIDENRFIEPSKIIFSEFLEDWFYRHYQNRITKMTFINREHLLKKHIIQNDFFSEKAISQITTADIDAFYNQKIKEDYSTSYIRQMHQLLNQSLTQAVKWGEINSNPVINADPPSVKYSQMFIWSREEIQVFLNECKSEPHYLTFLIAIYTGMRRGEILGLKWEDIDFTNKKIRVNRSLAYDPKGAYLFTSLKTKSSKRQLPLSEVVVNELRRHKDNQNKWKALVGELYQDRDLVICTITGTEQNPQNLVRVMKRIIKKTGVRKIRFHDIRHTYASILIAAGVDIIKVSSLLGHANPKITLEFYAHLLPGSQNEVPEIFHEAIKKREDEEEK